MDSYDALQQPEPAAWLALDEAERMSLVIESHEQSSEEVPEPTLHAVIHTIVENQVALGDETPVAATLERLQREGTPPGPGL